MRQLTDQQVRFAPLDRKLEQLERAEKFLTEIEPSAEYAYQLVCQQIIGYKTDIYPDMVIEGEVLQHDLRLFIEALSSSANITPARAGEPVLTVEEVSRLYNISTKTVSRWRDRGLVARRFLVEGRRRVGFLASSVERFVKIHADEVDRGSRFSQLTETEKEEIIRRARRLARVPHASLAEISRRVGKKLGRSPETIRYTIKNHDREQPQHAILPEMRGPMDDETKNRIFRSYRSGAGIESLAERFHRTRSTVYRIVNEMRAERLLSQPIDYMAHESFADPAMTAVILGPEPNADAPSKPARAPAGLPPYLQSLYEVPLLSREQEYHLFRKMNFLLHQANELRNKISAQHARASELDEIERLQTEAQEIKRRLIRANLRLVVSIAKKHVGQTGNLFELISDGNVSLMRAVEKFDYSRGFKFSTYASWAIMKNYARTIPAENQHRDRFVTGHETAFDLKADTRTDEYETEMQHQRMQSAVGKILDRLDDRERKIIVYRYGLQATGAPETLEQVGQRFGVTKERIRQIEARAISKLKRFANEEKLDVAFLN